MNVFKINKQKQVAMNEEQMKILKTGKKKKPRKTLRLFLDGVLVKVQPGKEKNLSR